MSAVGWRGSADASVDIFQKLKAVQSAGNELADVHGLPRPKFHVMNDGATSGVYLFGTKKIGISESDLATYGITEIAGTAGHEMTHLEQAKMIICNIADKAEIGKLASQQQIKQLNQVFESEFGFKAHPSFLKSVMEKRAGVRLTAEELARADMLHAAVVKDGPRKVAEFQNKAQSDVLQQLSMDVTSGSDSMMMGRSRG